MIKELNEEEYQTELMSGVGVSHFMGGCKGTVEGETIYLVENKIYLVSDDELDTINNLRKLQQIEAEDYSNQIRM